MAHPGRSLALRHIGASGVRKPITKVGGSAEMQDFVRDWRRWTMAERVIAVLITIGGPAALALTVPLTW